MACCKDEHCRVTETGGVAGTTRRVQRYVRFIHVAMKTAFPCLYISPKH